MKEVVQQHGPTFTQGVKPETLSISEDPEDQLMIMNVLTNTLYTDKVSAVLREYGCNAVDANVEAGKRETPIEVTLPNMVEPTVTIRDFGAGMDGDQIRQTFIRLGRSTKRQSNEFTGMLGIGSKAGFAYGDSFMVTSFVKGKRTIYNLFRDKGRPMYAAMHEEDTDQPDGIEIRVPVKVQDIPEFVSRAKRVYQYFKIRPVIKGAQVSFADNTPQIIGTGWRYIGNGQSVAIMGNVGYTITPASMGAVEQKYSTLLTLGVELDFELGDLEIAANREGLQYRDHTRNKIIERLKTVCAEIGKVFTDKIANAKSLWEATALYADHFEKMGSNQYGMRTLKDVVQGNVAWNGKVVNSGRFNLRNSEPIPGVSILRVSKRSYSTRMQRDGRVEYEWAGKGTALIINDLPSGKGSPARERGYFQAHPETTTLIIFHFANKKAQDTYWKARNLDGAPTVLYSTVTPAYTAATGGGGTPSAHRSKHSAKAFTLKETDLPASAYRNPSSAYWDKVSVDLQDDGGVYIHISMFNAAWEKVISPEPRWIVPQVQAMRKLGLIAGPVYGFKHDAIAKLGKKWVSLQDSVQKLINEKVAKHKLAQDLADYLHAASYKHVFDSKHHKLMPEGSLAREWLDEQQRMLTPKSLELLSYLHSKKGEPWALCPAVPKPTTDLAEFEKRVLARYPMLEIWDAVKRRFYNSTTRCTDTATADMAKFAEYVKLVEGKK